MNMYFQHILTFLIGFLTYVKTQICDMDCGPGYRCTLKRSTCQYPPCDFFPTCEPLSGSPAWSDASQERSGQCPTSDTHGPCINSCRMDSDCPPNKKCCENDCGRTCRHIVNKTTIDKPGTCPRHLNNIFNGCRRECRNDLDCSGVQKCCTTTCGSLCSEPCYYWLAPNQPFSRKPVIWKLPFICRI